MNLWFPSKYFRIAECIKALKKLRTQNKIKFCAGHLIIQINYFRLCSKFPIHCAYNWIILASADWKRLKNEGERIETKTQQTSGNASVLWEIDDAENNSQSSEMILLNL